MSNKKKRKSNIIESIILNESSRSDDSEIISDETRNSGRLNFASLARFVVSHRLAIGSTAICLLIAFGVMAKTGWLPHTDSNKMKRNHRT